MIKVDMHVHSKYSNDCASEPLKLFKLAEKRNICFAITDHNVFKNYDFYKTLMKNSNIFVIPGEEIKVYEGKELIGELLVYFIEKEIRKKQLWDVIDEAKNQDAIISIAHPYDITRKPYFKGFKKMKEVAKKVDAVEVFNSHCLTNAPNKKAEEFAEKNKLAKTAGSDAHLVNEIGNAYIKVYGTEMEEVRKAIKKRNTICEGKLSPKRNKLISPIINKFGKIIANR